MFQLKWPMGSQVISTLNSFATMTCGLKWATVSTYVPMGWCDHELAGGQNHAYFTQITYESTQ